MPKYFLVFILHTLLCLDPVAGEGVGILFIILDVISEKV